METRLPPFFSDTPFRHLSWILPALIIVCIIFVYPLSHGFYGSLFLRTPLGGFGSFVGFQNYIDVFRDSMFRAAFRRQAVFTFLGVGGETLLGLLFALLLDREFKGKGIVRSAIVIPFLLSDVMVGILARWIFHPELGVVNYVLGGLFGIRPVWMSPATTIFGLDMIDITLVLVWIWMKTPWNAVVIMSALATIPAELYEAAKIDGASRLQVFQKVTFPMIAPILLVNLLFRTLVSLRAFGVVYTMTDFGSVTNILSTLTYNVYWYFNRPGHGLAIGFTIFSLSICVYLVSRFVEKRAPKWI